MSLINKMLQDLDRRQALGAGSDAAVMRPPSAKPQRREWFWGTLAVLMTLSVAWVSWVAIQLLPRQIATELALRVADEARNRPQPLAQAAAPVEKPAPLQPVEAAPSLPPAPIPETLKLALQLETPLKPETLKPKAAAKAQQPAARPQQPAANGSVNKRDRTRSRSEIAEGYFRQAAVLLNHARVSEAEDHLVAALQADAGHVAARQTYIALLLEQQRIEVARRQLQEALAINPTQATFALALARIYTEQREYQSALQVMDKVGSAAKNADLQVLRAVVLQRLGRYPEAVEAYQNAIRGGPQPGATWLGLGISLEGLGRKAEAVQAYRRALGAGQLTAEAREYAETRTRALE
jgi:MSHA biogenesis protein MshN